MSQTCTRIRLRELPSNIAQCWVDDDGCVYFDLAAGYYLEQDKVNEKITNINEIEFSRTITAALQYTDKNAAILECFLDPNTVGQQYEEIPIDIIEGGCVTGQKHMLINGCNYQGINATILLDKNHWARKMSELSICDIKDLGQYTHQCPDIPNEVDPHIYNGSNPTWNILVDYGELGYRGYYDSISKKFICKLCHSDFRPWFNVEHIMEKLWCTIGYKFESPTRDTEKWNRLWDYLLKCDFGTGDEARCLDAVIQSSEFALTQPQFYLQNGHDAERCLFMTDVIADTKGSWQNNRYCNNGCVDIKGKLNLSVDEDMDDDNEIIIRIRKRAKGDPENTGTILWTQRIASGGDYLDEQGFDFDIQDVSITDCQELCITMESTKHGGDVKANVRYPNSYIEFIGKRLYFEEGKTYEIADLLKCNINAYDWFKSKAQAFGWNFDTNEGLNTVFAASPYPTKDVDGTQVEPFYTGETIDWTSKVIEKTKDVQAPSADTERYCKVSWKKSSDCYIDELDLSEELFSHTFDRGARINNNKTKSLENILIEPTAQTLKGGSRKTYTVNANNDFYITYISLPLCIPKMCGTDGAVGDNEKMSWCFGDCVRMLLGFGNVVHGIPNVGGLLNSQDTLHSCIDLCGEETPLVPTAGMFMDCPIGDESGNPTPANIYAPTDCNLVFNEVVNSDGDPLPNLFNQYLAKVIAEDIDEANMNYLVDLDTNDFDCYNFRQCVTINLNGKPVTVRVAEILGFRRCLDELTPVTFKPLTQSYSNVCGVIDPSGIPGNNGEGECDNFPTIFCVKNGDCFDLSIGGTINGTILNSTFFCQLVSGGAVTTLTNTSPITATVCGKTEPFNVWATVTFANDADGNACPDKTTPIKLITPCGDNQPQLRCEGFYKSANGYCLKAFIEGDIFDPFTINSFTVDGQPYVEGTEICGFAIGQTVPIEAILNFDDACDPITVSLDCLIPVENGNCDDNQATLTLEPDADGCCLPVVDVICAVEKVAGIFVWYACTDDAANPPVEGVDEICLWDGKTPICCDGILWVKALVLFCGKCDEICIDWISAVKDSCPDCEINPSCTDCVLSLNPTCTEYTWVVTDPDGNAVPDDGGNTYQLLLDGIYTITGTLAGCDTITDTYEHEMPDAGGTGGTTTIQR